MARKVLARAPRIDTEGPAAIRQLAGFARAGGANAVMKGSWRDPEDIRPNAARRAREISGWRTFCPLRRMMAGKGSQIEERHILAADVFRRDVDQALIGTGGARDMTGIHAGFESKPPSAAAMTAVWSSAAVARALACFAPGQRAMLVAVVLLNRTVYAWCEAAIGDAKRDPKVEMGRLLAILDVLAEHYGGEVAESLAAGHLLGAA